MILFSHPTGNANVRHAALALAEVDLLREFWTCLGWNPDSAINRLLPAKVKEQLGRRALPGPVRAVARYRPWREIGRMACMRAGIKSMLRHERGPFSIDAVYRDLDRTVARRTRSLPGVQSVYAYEDGAADTFAAASDMGLKCIYDLPAGYWRSGHILYDEEKVRTPEWACTLSGLLDSPEKLARKDEELRLADLVVVASGFAKNTLALAPHPVRAIQVIPYGAPPPIGVSRPADKEGKLKVLFAGALGQHKGFSYLLRAVAMLGPKIELTLLGRKTSEICAPLNEAVKRYRWIPSLPHHAVLEEMRRHHVFVLPSLSEGFGLVLLEAMAQGLPIITTANTAGPDIIDEGQSGFIVPVRSAEAIADKLDLLARDRSLLRDMQNAAQLTATRFTWESYRNRIAAVVQAVLAPSRDSVSLPATLQT